MAHPPPPRISQTGGVNLPATSNGGDGARPTATLRTLTIREQAHTNGPRRIRGRPPAPSPCLNIWPSA
eukprot:scaffold37623_cov275-Isochrysis_galbana.AAC.2